MGDKPACEHAGMISLLSYAPSDEREKASFQGPHERTLRHNAANTGNADMPETSTRMRPGTMDDSRIESRFDEEQSAHEPCIISLKVNKLLVQR